MDFVEGAGLPPVLDESQRPAEDVYTAPPVEVPSELPQDSQLPDPASPVEIPPSQPRDAIPEETEEDKTEKDGNEEDGDGKKNGDGEENGDGKKNGDGEENGDGKKKGDDGKQDEKIEEPEMEEHVEEKLPAKPPTRTAAAVKTRPKKKLAETTQDEIKELPMVTREAQQAQKKLKANVGKMDAAEEPKTGRIGGGKNQVLKRPAAKPAANRGKQSNANPKAQPASQEVEMVESDSDREEGCKKNLSQEFAAAADLPKEKQDKKSRASAPSKTEQPKPKAQTRKREIQTEMHKEPEQMKKPRKEKQQKTDKTGDKTEKDQKTEGEDTKEKVKATFAGRRCPAENEDAIKRFQVIKKVFQEAILPKVHGPISALEATDKHQKKLVGSGVGS